MFYTGTSLGENLKRQRIGVATSSDLHDWHRFEKNPVVDLDPRYYEEYDPPAWHDRSLRDPWVMPGPAGDGFRMWFTARAKTGAADGRGVIGTARSDDLLTWHAEPPVTPPGDFGECEVPEYFAAGKHAYLLFCTSDRRTSAARRAKLAAKGKSPETGTHYFIADRPGRSWRLAPAPFLSGSLYAGRIVEGPDGRPMFLGTIGRAADGTYVGAVSDPIPVTIAADGTLRLENAPALV